MGDSQYVINALKFRKCILACAQITIDVDVEFNKSVLISGKLYIINMIRKIKKLLFLLQNKLFVKPLFSGVAAAIEHRRMLESLNCKFVADVGANKGQFALAVRSYLPEARIVSFEPLDAPANIFETIFSGDERVKLYRYAIGDKDEESVIHISSSEDSSSLLPITEKQSTLYPGTNEVYRRIIKVKRLSHVLKKEQILQPALLKIDVQGFELSTLKGAVDLLDAFEYIYVECSFVELYLGQSLAYEVLAFLSKYGFNLSGIYNI